MWVTLKMYEVDMMNDIFFRCLIENVSSLLNTYLQHKLTQDSEFPYSI